MHRKKGFVGCGKSASHLQHTQKYENVCILDDKQGQEGQKRGEIATP